MNNEPGMFGLPPPMTISAQAAVAIRRAIEQGVWREHLPSERRLCDYLRISRPTVRNALRLLAKDGLLETRHGRRHRLVRSPAPTTAAAKRLVVLVTQESVAHMTQNADHAISELRAHLAEQGFVTDLIHCPRGTPRAQVRTLRNFVRQSPVFCCVLISVSRALQRWCCQRSLPALVVGTCHKGISLPSLDIDYRAVCRHAVGVFLAKGHRQLALVVHDSGIAGDLASEQGFQEGIERHRGKSEARALIVRHDGSARNITAKLDAIFKSPQPPTALLVARSWAVFAVVIYLLKRGRSVPDAVSLIARDQDSLFESVEPPIAHYRLEPGAFAHRLSRMMVKLVNQGRLAPEPQLLFPRLSPGGTVKHVGG